MGRDDSCSASLVRGASLRFPRTTARATRPACRPPRACSNRTGRPRRRARRRAAPRLGHRREQPRDETVRAGIRLEHVPSRDHEGRAVPGQDGQPAARRTGVRKRDPHRQRQAGRPNGHHPPHHLRCRDELRGHAHPPRPRASQGRRIAWREVRAIGGELFSKPGDGAGRLDRPRRHPLLNQLEHGRGARLAGALFPRPPDRSRRQGREQHEDGESGVEHAHAAAACGG